MSVSWDIDYTLEIDFERLTEKDLQYILQLLYNCSSECNKDIGCLVDEVIGRINVCEYSLREKHNRYLRQLAVSTFNTLKQIVASLGILGTKTRDDLAFINSFSEKIRNIHTIYNKFMCDDVSPGVSPVSSPVVLPGQASSNQVKIPKIMKKVKEVSEPPSSQNEGRGIKFPKIMDKMKKLG